MALRLGSLDLPLACLEVEPFDSEMKPIDYPGVRGRAYLDMGSRARPIHIKGRLRDALSGSTKDSDIYALSKSVVADLVETIGTTTRTFRSCRVVSANVGPKKKTASGKYTAEYTVELEQLGGTNSETSE